MNQRSEKTTWLVGGLITAGASILDLFTDFLDFLLIGFVLSPIIDIVYILSFCLYLLIKNKLTWRRFSIIMGAMVGKALPLIGFLPFLTGITAYVFFDIIREENLPSSLNKFL